MTARSAGRCAPRSADERAGALAQDHFAGDGDHAGRRRRVRGQGQFGGGAAQLAQRQAHGGERRGDVALDAGDLAGYSAALEPTVPLARHLFEAPTSAYKTGIVFLAWLAGHQPAFAMVGGATTARSVPHLIEAFRLADRAGLLPDPELAAFRVRAFLAVHGG
nr:DUF993 family protein [Cryptosporangium arvum]